MDDFGEIDLAGVRVRFGSAPRPAPTPGEIDELLDFAGGSLPADYLEAMRRIDGFGAWFGDEDGDEGYIVLHPCAEIIKENDSYGFGRGRTPLLVVGGDGGGEAFAIDLQTSQWLMVNLSDLPTTNSAFYFKDLRALLDAFIADTAFDR